MTNTGLLFGVNKPKFGVRSMIQTEEELIRKSEPKSVNRIAEYTNFLLSISSTIKFLNVLTGTPATDAANMIDVSGAAHDGTYKGTWAAAQRVAKGFGWMLNPNGTNNYISLGDSTDFSFGDGANDTAFTIAGIIQVVATTDYQDIVSKYDGTSGVEAREWALIIQNDETLIMYIYDESANVNCYRLTNAAVSTGFHTFAVTYSGVGGATAANGIIIYIDGAVVASTATNNAAYVAMENLGTSVFVGARTGASAIEEFMTGDFTPPIIDKGTVWTAAQVLNYHQRTSAFYYL